MPLPNEDAIRWLVSRYADFLAKHGEAIGTPDLVLPTGEFFPDEFTLDPEGVMRVAKRVLAHAPVSDDLDLKLGFFEPEGAHDHGGCGSGACGSHEGKSGGGGCGSGACGSHEGKSGGGCACGTHEAKSSGGGCGSGACGSHDEQSAQSLGGDVLETAEGYAITLNARDAGNPTLLTTALARGTGGIVLSEAGEEIDPEQLAAMSELVASAVGFGVLMTNGAYVYGKSCGGVSVRQATHLTLSEHALLLALFCRMNDHSPSAARAHFGPSHKEALDEALAWVDSNEHVLEALRTHPESLTDGVFTIGQTKGFFARLFSRRSPGVDDVASTQKPAQKKERSEAEQRRLAEARALVDEALRDR